MRPITLDPLRLKNAGRSAFAGVIALALTLIYRLPHGYWALVTVIVITQPNVSASLSKGAMRLVGTVLGAILAVVLLHLVQEPIPFVFLLFIITALASYFSTGKFYPYAFTVLGITTVMVSTLGLLAPEQGVYLAVYRSAEILIGILIAIAVFETVWPTRAEYEFPRQLCTTIRSCTDLFHATCTAYVAGHLPSEGLRARTRNLSHTFKTHLTLLEQASTESRFYQIYRQLFLRLILLLEEVVIQITELQGALSESHVPALYHEFRAELTALIDETVQTFSALENAIHKRAAYMVPPTLDASISALETRYAGLRGEGRLAAYTIQDVARFDSFVLAIRELTAALRKMSTIISHLAFSEGEKEAPATGQLGTSKRQGFSWILPPEARRLKHGIKCALAVLVTMFGWILLQWPSGASAVLTAYVVMQGSIGASHRKMMLRFLGALGGGVLAILAIIFIIPRIDTLYSFSVLVFAVMFLCAYISSGSERISYAGFQAAIAFSLTLLPGPLQSVSMTPAFTRCITVLFGAAIGALIVRFVWPIHAGRELREKLAGALRECGTLFQILTEQVVHGSQGANKTATLTSSIKGSLDQSLSLLGEATLEPDEQGIRSGKGLALIEAIDTLLFRLRAVGSALETPIDPTLTRQIALEVEHLNRSVGSILHNLAGSLLGTVDVPGMKDLTAGLDQLDQRLRAIREEGDIHTFPAEQTMAFLSLIERIKEVVQAVLEVAAIQARKKL